MELPNDPIVYIVLIVVVAAAVGYAIWRRYTVVLKHGDTEMRFERPGDAAPAGAAPAESGSVSVGKGMVIKGGKVGDITGVKGAGRVNPLSSVPMSSVDVMSGASAENAELGDITGVSQGGTADRKTR